MWRRATGSPLSKRLRLYIKPEDRKAYYVVNEKVSGSVDL